MIRVPIIDAVEQFDQHQRARQLYQQTHTAAAPPTTVALQLRFAGMPSQWLGLAWNAKQLAEPISVSGHRG
jgi:hypothetical protein